MCRGNQGSDPHLPQDPARRICSSPARFMCWCRSRRSRWCRRSNSGEGETPFLKVVQAGAPNFPLWIFGFITMFAVANSALINMLMASRLVYGMSRERVLPAALGHVHKTRRTPYIAIGFTTLLAFGLITFVGEVPALGGTTALLLLAVFTVVNIAVLVLRRDHGPPPSLQDAYISSDPRRVDLRVPGGPMDRPGFGSIHDRRHAYCGRRRAVGRDRARQSSDGPDGRGTTVETLGTRRPGQLICVERRNINAVARLVAAAYYIIDNSRSKEHFQYPRPPPPLANWPSPTA